MFRMFPTKPTILTQCQTIRRIVLTFNGIVVPLFALCTLQNNMLTHYFIPPNILEKKFMEPTTGLEPVTSSLPRKCSTG